MSVLCNSCLQRGPNFSSKYALCGSPKSGSAPLCVKTANTKVCAPPISPDLQKAADEFLSVVTCQNNVKGCDADVIFSVSNSLPCRDAYLNLQKEIMNTLFGDHDATTGTVRRRSPSYISDQHPLCRLFVLHSPISPAWLCLARPKIQPPV
ncbi:uncharacterized protein EI90DRAFT_635827 [Cantharellus anzutake]|uniref:uncharacterized protein n=1 Tax=Cantharellus anzutake TaxID=1750568 RepID=UPI001906C234|nr:uncharacterized protein EI90DRAFT_635827 [Cantharellus anzutake]KAF8333162.1 hypothetical protein EI90DRAFT_635827 [Cantharellus anzutake]